MIPHNQIYVLYLISKQNLTTTISYDILMLGNITGLLPNSINNQMEDSDDRFQL